MFDKARIRSSIEVALAESGAIVLGPKDTSTICIGTSGRVTLQAQVGLYKSTYRQSSLVGACILNVEA